MSVVSLGIFLKVQGYFKGLLAEVVQLIPKVTEEPGPSVFHCA